MHPNRKLVPWGLFLVCAMGAACSTVPYTNRSQFVMVDAAQENSMGAAAYKQVLAKETLSKNAAAVSIVREVGERIARAANRPDFQWEFNVIEKDEANAWALPGGKVAVYTGLFPIAKDTAGLAAVMGHEVAHVLAHHGAERQSQGVLAEMGGVLLGVGLSTQGMSPGAVNAAMQVYGAGAAVGIMLPFSREHESEADHIGMILMAKAGYDPEAALQLWRRFESAGGAAPPEFLSTHPNPSTRQEDIQKWLPEARGYLRPDYKAPVKTL